MIRSFEHQNPTIFGKPLLRVLCCYREIPEISIGCLPFELLDGWLVREPFCIVKNSLIHMNSDEEYVAT